MGKMKRIGGLIFKRSKTGLHYVGVAGKKTYGAGKYIYEKHKEYRAGELSRLKQRAEKERIKASIRHYRQQYKPKSKILSDVERFFSPPKSTRVRHKKRPIKRHRRRVTEYW